jgi:hypothetical protein
MERHCDSPDISQLARAKALYSNRIVIAFRLCVTGFALASEFRVSKGAGEPKKRDRMKRLIVLLCLMFSAGAYADVQTWTFQDVSLYADEDPYVGLPRGPAGSLTGFFQYDTETKSIPGFLIHAGSSILTPERWAAAYFITPTTIIFDTGYTPAASTVLKLILTQPLARASVPISTESVLYRDYGYSAIHLIGGSVTLTSTAIAVPER